jgi:hypothetical protein
MQYAKMMRNALNSGVFTGNSRSSEEISVTSPRIMQQRLALSANTNSRAFFDSATKWAHALIAWQRATGNR